jgi:hypothetical protein
MRKVYVEGEALVLFPLQVKFSAVVHLNDGESLPSALRAFEDKAIRTTADVESIEVKGVTNLPPDGEPSIESLMESRPFHIVQYRIMDSK